ncbi:MAG TPA: hypothetical protein VHE37_11590 [Nevskiaceae bacterium]|nr:hypothetical protein [Nevskiaceae bacterium]
MFQVYDVRELQRLLRMRRAQALGIFLAGGLFGLLCSQPGVAQPGSSARTAHTPSCEARATFRLDCSLPST